MASFKGAALTKRSVSNTTGIDMLVPKFDTSRGAGRDTLYHIIVVSVFSVFKSDKHGPDDVVQFSVPRKYSEFEKLQERLSIEFSAIVFPVLPPTRLYCTEDDLEDRMVAFDSLVRVIAKTKRLSRSRSLLKFLGASDKAIEAFMEECASKKKSKGQAAASIKEPEPPLEEEAIDIFAEDDVSEETRRENTEQELTNSSSATPDMPDVSLHASVRHPPADFMVDDYVLEAGKQRGAESEKRNEFLEKKTVDLTKELTETDSDLFDLDTDLGSLDHLTKPKKSKKPKSHAKAKARTVDESDSMLSEKQFAEIDLQQYIASNAAAAADDVDLFS